VDAGIATAINLNPWKQTMPLILITLYIAYITVAMTGLGLEAPLIVEATDYVLHIGGATIILILLLLLWDAAKGRGLMLELIVEGIGCMFSILD
jgi:hypothetical protein